MQEILQHINRVEGIIGSAVFSDSGDVLSQAFPLLIDAASLKTAAKLALECAHGLQISQAQDQLDLRYAEGRIIVRPFPGAMLCLLCSKAVNMQVLTITLNLAIKKLEPKLHKASVQAEAAPAPPAATQSEAVGTTGNLKLTISHLINREASSSFDSLGMIAVSQSTAKYIGEYYKSAFKKLNLCNVSDGSSGIFPVMVMNDLDPMFDGTIIIGPKIEKKLKLSEGDKVEVKLG